MAAGCGRGEPPDDSGPVGMVQQALTVQLEAENGTNNGGQLEGGGDSGSKVILNSSGDSVCWSGTNMSGINKVTIHHSNGEPAGDSLIAKYNGVSLGSAATSATSGWSTPLFANAVVNFSAQSGSGTFCVEGSGSGWIAGLDYVLLEGSSVCTPSCSGKQCG
ncbi:MAG TPA: hypothetical protein VM686_27165, partial [Polyangiaceae bacterium]|nr:hypothetical protein [Polyangiaceae bacterium]